MNAECDLFGEPVVGVLPAPPGTGKRKPTKLRGYAAAPGSGPKGETCKTCEYYCRVHGHAKAYLKCRLMKQVWTNGPGTDILARSAACARWQKAT